MPAGDDGTFSVFNLYRHQVTANTTFRIGNKGYELWKQVLIMKQQMQRSMRQFVLGNVTKETLEYGGEGKSSCSFSYRGISTIFRF
jgi:hypothetical protein